MKACFETVILPRLKMRREELMTTREEMLAKLPKPLGPAPAQTGSPDPPGIIFMIDGEKTCLDAALQVFGDAIEADPTLKGLRLVKLSASCSKSEQPCDVSPSYRVMKGLFKSWKHNISMIPVPEYMQLVEAPDPAPHSKGIARCLHEFLQTTEGTALHRLQRKERGERMGDHRYLPPQPWPGTTANSNPNYL